MAASPKYNLEEDEIYMKTKFTQDISDRMTVPKRIRATGDYFDNDNELYGNSNGNSMNSWNYHEKLEMNVPDRIVVIGQDQTHVLTSGTKSQPREIVLENSILPKDPGFIRVSTPPRVISLNDHHFPSASDEPEEEHQQTRNRNEPKSLDFFDDQRSGISNKSKRYEQQQQLYSQEMVINHREGTPAFSGSIENLSSHDEILHLRKQVAKMNRRIMNVEIDNLQRNQREKIVCVIGIAYFLLKSFLWLNRK